MATPWTPSPPTCSPTSASTTTISVRRHAAITLHCPTLAQVDSACRRLQAWLRRWGQRPRRRPPRRSHSTALHCAVRAVRRPAGPRRLRERPFPKLIMRVLHSPTQAFCTFRQGCIAGSHRPGAPLPTHDGWQKSWATPELRGAEWPADVDVHRVSVNAGDASKTLQGLTASVCARVCCQSRSRVLALLLPSPVQ